METSAKENINVSKAFEELSRKLIILKYILFLFIKKYILRQQKVCYRMLLYICFEYDLTYC